MKTLTNSKLPKWVNFTYLFDDRGITKDYNFNIKEGFVLDNKRIRMLIKMNSNLLLKFKSENNLLLISKITYIINQLNNIYIHPKNVHNIEPYTSNQVKFKHLKYLKTNQILIK